MGKAQDRQFNRSQFTKIGNLEGLRVKCIIQDKQGFRWFGTETGLYRYDGYHTELISTTSAGIQLTADFVLSLYEDRQANLWIGTSNGLLQLSADRKSIKKYLMDSGEVAVSKKSIHAITQTYDGAIWCSADDGYLYQSADKQTFSRIQESFASDYTGLQRVIRYISEDAAHQIWVADIQHGFRKLNQKGQLLKDYSLPDNRLRLACFANTSLPLFAELQKVFIYAPYSDEFVPLENVARSGLSKT
jgi:ligand-binding sensor domain-containing protein